MRFGVAETTPPQPLRTDDTGARGELPDGAAAAGADPVLAAGSPQLPAATGGDDAEVSPLGPA